MQRRGKKSDKQDATFEKNTETSNNDLRLKTKQDTTIQKESEKESYMKQYTRQIPEPKKYGDLIYEIERGDIFIPQFQRKFVWSLDKTINLIDSIVKNYPIGTFILWHTKDSLRNVRKIGNFRLPEPPKDRYISYILDGQQRITSLFACIKGEKIHKDDFSKIYIKLFKDGKDESLVVKEKDIKKNKNDYISIQDLMVDDNSKISRFKEYDDKKFNLIFDYRHKIKEYPFSVIKVDANINTATEIFTRVNTHGKKLESFDIMVAKTYDERKNFDLSKKYEELEESLKTVGYEIPKNTVLQIIAFLLDKKNCTNRTILNLDKSKFIDIYQETENAIKETIEHLRHHFRIPVSKILPYPAIMVPLAYFFYKHKSSLTGEQERYLQDFFWRSAISERYSVSVNSALEKDIKFIDKILAKNQPYYNDNMDDDSIKFVSSPEFIIKNGSFNLNSGYIKTILCLYAYCQPKSFKSNALINLDHSNLTQKTSRHYHHFFPKGFMKNKPNSFKNDVDHVLNITLIDAASNISYKDHPPSIYTEKFEGNPKLSETMKTHLIGDLDEFGIRNNDYDKFIQKRAEFVSQELKSKLVLVLNK